MATFASVRPMLECASIDATIAFYTDRLGFTCTGMFGFDEDNPTWCSLVRDGVGFMFNTTEPTHTHDDGSVHEAHDPLLTGGIYVNVDDVDALFDEIKSRVDAFEFEPETMVYGMREFALRDNNGYLLIFGTPTDTP